VGVGIVDLNDEGSVNLSVDCNFSSAWRLEGKLTELRLDIFFPPVMTELLLELELELEVVSDDLCRPYVFGGILPILLLLPGEA
jgi:hypothetical protein